MKKTKLSLTIAGLMLASAIVITSCKKKDTTTTPDTSTTSTTDNNTAQQNSTDITNFGSEGIDNSTLTTYKLASNNNGGPASVMSGVSGSVSVTVTGTKQIQVTFASFIGYDGHTRNGTIQYDWYNSTNNATWFRDSGLVLNISTPNHDYTVDNYTVQINSKTITNNGRNASGYLNWTDNSNLTITKPASAGGGTIQWQANWNTALLNTSTHIYNGTSYPAAFNGYGGTVANCINWPAAILSVSSTGFSGTASDGETYTGNISTPLVLNFNCTAPGTKYLYVEGVLNFTPAGKTTRTINYGSGTCDLTYVVSIGSYSLTITI